MTVVPVITVVVIISSAIEISIEIGIQVRVNAATEAWIDVPTPIIIYVRTFPRIIRPLIHTGSIIRPRIIPRIVVITPSPVIIIIIEHTTPFLSLTSIPTSSLAKIANFSRRDRVLNLLPLDFCYGLH